MATADLRSDHIAAGGMLIHPCLYDLVKNEVAPGTGVEPEHFWQSLSAIVRELGPRNRQLLDQRIELQRQIDVWHKRRKGASIDCDELHAFLREIEYVVDVGDDFKIETKNVDAEIASIAGPQLVVPVNNARYALNAANARWGSLYDALYGTDAIARGVATTATVGYDAERGAQVIARANAFLDAYFPLTVGSWNDVAQFAIEATGAEAGLRIATTGKDSKLSDSSQFVGYCTSSGKLTTILLRHHGLHVEIQIDREHPIGQQHPAGIKDVVLEAAITTIQDCEDSVAAIDGEDKALVYRNWLGLMKGNLEAAFEKNGRIQARRLEPDRQYTSPSGDTVALHGRSLLMVRIVGMHMYTDAVTTADGQAIPEAFLDAMVTSLAAVHDLKGNGLYRNSRARSVYIVKPKQHGPDEVALTAELFERVEQALSLPANTLKIGIMDEERRTTVNLKECIRKTAQRVVFINTGFLDRTGDEIHTLMEAGPFVRKPEIKNAAWLAAYENNNVDVGLATGFRGIAQIGKGMWAMPDQMASMVQSKVAHPRAGANTAWVPSPTAAVLHAMHYHEIDVAAKQSELANRPPARIADILTPCLLDDRRLSAAEIQQELDNNAQSILGYVVRWIDQGIGCSKVPDINNVGLMEDRATLRISSQHIANWLHHGVLVRDQIIDTFRRMATVVDGQNKDDANYRNMAPAMDGNLAFKAALALVFDGRDEPNGYTERVLTLYRRQRKQQAP